MASRRHPGEHPFHHDLAQQVLRRERVPRRQLDLTAVDVAATRTSHADLAGTQHDLAGRCAMPVPDALGSGQLDVLRADARGELGLQHLTHHDQPRRRRERQQTVSHRTGDIANRHGRLQRQTSQLADRVRCRDLHHRYLLLHGDPSPSGCLGGLPNLASTARPGEGSPPHFNRRRDNLTRIASM
jgi:hypothetical protein